MNAHVRFAILLLLGLAVVLATIRGCTTDEPPAEWRPREQAVEVWAQATTTTLEATTTTAETTTTLEANRTTTSEPVVATQAPDVDAVRSATVSWLNAQAWTDGEDTEAWEAENARLMTDVYAKEWAAGDPLPETRVDWETAVIEHIQVEFTGSDKAVTTALVTFEPDLTVTFVSTWVRESQGWSLSNIGGQ